MAVLEQTYPMVCCVCEQKRLRLHSNYSPQKANPRHAIGYETQSNLVAEIRTVNIAYNTHKTTQNYS